MKIKIKKSKKSKMKEQICFLKSQFVYLKIMEGLRQSNIDKELLEFIETSSTFEDIEDSSEYGINVFKLDFIETIWMNNEGFFKFIKVDKQEFINRMIIYREELNKVA